MSTAQLIPPETGIKGLRASAGFPLPFARQVHAHSFVLERPPGAVLIYGAGEAEADLAAAASPTRRYLSHQHEAVYAAELPDVPLFVHDADRGPVEEHLAVRGTFTRRHVLDNDLEVIPIPGHTPGAAAFLWDTGSQRLLFSSDSIYLSDGEWVGALLDSSDRGEYLESLELMRGLEFDALVPWAANEGESAVALTDPADSRRRIGRVIDRIRAGGTR